jgi:hypothetical protein
MVGRRVILAGVSLAAAVLAAPALAADASPVCLNSGRQYKVGETACIAACHGERRLARCDLVAEKPSWTFISNVCPEVLLPPSPWDTTIRPVAVAMTPIPFPVERIMSEMSPEAWMRLADRMKASAAAGAY